MSNIPILYFNDLTVSGIANVSAISMDVPNELPSLYLKVSVDKTQFFALNGGIKWVKETDASGVVLGINAEENYNVNHPHLLDRFDGMHTIWNIDSIFSINYFFNEVSRTTTMSTGISNNNLGSNKFGSHVLLMAANAFKGQQVNVASDIFSNTSSAITQIQNNIVLAIRSYLASASRQQLILDKIREANAPIFPGSSGTLEYPSSYSDMALVFNIDNVVVDVNNNNVTQKITLRNVPLYVLLTTV